MDDRGLAFLLLMWIVTLAALIGAVWLFKDIRFVSEKASGHVVSPVVTPSILPGGFVLPPPPVPRAAAANPQPRLTVPPPPF